jgi:RNA polymerase sigma factor (sigma-70 family)
LIEAEDVQQEVIAKLLQYGVWQQATPQLLFTMAKNAALNMRRTNKLETSHDIEERIAWKVPGTEPDPADHLVQQEGMRKVADHVDTTLGQLSGKGQQVARLYYAQGLDTAAVGKVLGMKPAAVRAHLSRANQQLGDLANDLKLWRQYAHPAERQVEVATGSAQLKAALS